MNKNNSQSVVSSEKQNQQVLVDERLRQFEEEKDMEGSTCDYQFDISQLNDDINCKYITIHTSQLARVLINIFTLVQRRRKKER